MQNFDKFHKEKPALFFVLCMIERYDKDFKKFHNLNKSVGIFIIEP